MDIGVIGTVITTGFIEIGFIYLFFRKFKQDINSHIDRLGNRMNTLERRIDSMDERMFYLSTGRSLSDAILSQKTKEKSE